MSSLPQKLPWDRSSTVWAQALDPLVSNPLMQGQLLMDQKLVAGVNVINHKLGRKLIGYFPVGQTAFAEFSNNQATNQTPQLTLSLNSSAVTTVSLWVF